MRHELFISYARAEQERALLLANVLRPFGMEPWVDQTSIPVSVPWMDEITKGIRTAEMVLILDSPAWRASANCAAELTIAQSLHKRVVWLDSTASPEEWIAQAQEAYGTLSDDEVLRAGLLGDSFRWEAAGRQRSHLATGRRLNWFRSYRRQHAQLVDRTAANYIDRSTRARRLRRIAAVTAGLLVVALMVGARLVQEVDESVTEQYQETLAEQSLAYTLTGTLRADAYRGLREAIDRATDTPGWVADEGLSRALDANLPIALENLTGRRPDRAPVLADGALAEHGGSSAVLNRLDNSVRLHTSTGADVRVQGRGRTSAMAWSPDGSHLAVADADGVQIVRADTGRTISVLRGLDGAIDALRWPGPGVVEGHAGTVKATWHVGDQILFSDPAVRFVGAESNPDRTRAMALRSDGSYVVVADGIDVSEVHQLQELKDAYSVAWVHESWMVGGQNAAGHGVLVQLDSDAAAVRSWPIGDQCIPNAIAEGRDGVAWVVCYSEFEVTRLELDSGMVSKIAIQGQPLAVLEDSGGDLLVRTYSSEVFRVPAGGSPSLVGPWGSLCMGSASILAPSLDRRSIIAGGDGHISCTTFMPNPENRSISHMITPPGEDNPARLRAAVWTRDGVVVLGWVSGHVWFYDPPNGSTRSLVVPTGAA